MAITFREQTKKQRNLIFVLLAIGLITALLIWQGFLKPQKLPEVEVFKPIKKIEINFEILKNPFFEKLRSFEGIPALSPEEKIGRENPFKSY